MDIVHFCSCVGQSIEVLLNDLNTPQVVPAGEIDIETGRMSVSMWSVERGAWRLWLNRLRRTYCFPNTTKMY